MTAAAELRIFAFCLCAGIVIGIGYDILSLLRYPFHSVLLDALFDLLFYCLALIVSAAALFFSNDGIIRFYSLAGILLGVFLYMRLPSRFFRFLLRKTFKNIHK